MFQWLRKLLFKTSAPAKITTEKNGESLTDWENFWIAKHLNCPDCEGGKLLKGPEGGMSMNCLCEFCWSEFNITLFNDGKGTQCWGERITDKCGADEQRLKFYGIEVRNFPMESRQRKEQAQEKTNQ